MFDRSRRELLLQTTVDSELDSVHIPSAESLLNGNQRRLARLINSLPGIVFSRSTDAHWSMLYLSEGCFRLTGYHSEDLVGDEAICNYTALIHSDDVSLVWQTIQQAVIQQQPYVAEYRICTRAGEERWLWEKGYGVFVDGAIAGIEGFITDISDRKQAEHALQQTELKYRSIFENAVEGIFQSKPDGHYITVNPMLAKIYGYDSPQDLINQLTNIEHQLYVDPNRRAEFVRLMQHPGVVFGFESQIYRKDGSVIWISECAHALYDGQGQLIGFEGTVEDITRRKQAELELHRRDRLLQGVAAATNHLLAHSTVVSAIPEALEILGRAVEVDRAYIFENHPHSETAEPAMSLRFEWTSETAKPLSYYTHCINLPYSALEPEGWYDTFTTGKSVSGIVRELPSTAQTLLAREGVLATIMVPIFMNDRLWGFIGFDDCRVERRWSASEESILVAIAASLGSAIKRQHTEDQMRYQAFHDALTGLPNRTLFDHRLHIALTQAKHSNEMLAVMFLDLDRFKTINDTLGHAIGDQLLQQATQRLTACLREEDTIARWGGDEFTLILPSLKHPEDGAKIAQRIADSLRPTFYVDYQELHITSSVGIALYPHDGQTAETLLKNADAALYRAKEQGRANCQFYTAALNSQASQRLSLDNSLHGALEREEFVIYYQPQFNAQTGQVTQIEALLRWQHPDFGLVPPQTFIALAEENGLIVPIGEWVLQKACAQNKAWQLAGLPPVRVAVNLSARQFQQPNLLEQVAQILQETGLDPRYLELEITETAAMQDVDFAIEVLRQLKDMGVRIALDDFGTGYSSLNYLRKFPLHALKIDQSFVHNLTDSAADLAIITAIVTLGHGLQLNVVAEGVETLEQVERLRSLHCEEMQGYWFSRPLTAEEATQFLQTQL